MTRSCDTSRLRTMHVLLFLAVLLAVRLLILLVPVDLIPDEAYYWDWSRKLDLCYFSKPPMIAWLIGLATAVGGTHTWVVRAPAALLNTSTLALLFALGTRMFSRRTGLLALLAFLCSPGGILSGVFHDHRSPAAVLLGCRPVLSLARSGGQTFTAMVDSMRPGRRGRYSEQADDAGIHAIGSDNTYPLPRVACGAAATGIVSVPVHLSSISTPAAVVE